MQEIQAQCFKLGIPLGELFLLSDLAAGVTSEITYVDGGFSQATLGGLAAAGPTSSVVSGLSNSLSIQIGSGSAVAPA